MTHASARHATLAEINITPLIDVLLVLMIIFLITAPLLAQRIDLELNGTPPIDPKPVIAQSLVVQADGSVRWDGVLLPFDAVATQMRVAARDDSHLRVTAADGVRYASVAPVLAEARAAGIEAIDVALEAR